MISPDNTKVLIIVPRTLKAEIQAHTDKTGESMCEVARRAMTAYLNSSKENELEVQQ